LVCFSSDPYFLSLKLTTLRIFIQKEVELARARIGRTDSKPLTGLFKWKDIKRWHTTWHVYLYKPLSNGYSFSNANEKQKLPLYFTFAAQFGQSGGSRASSAPLSS
jgi:ACS family pantothenate transporter-like MFS transporter